MSETETWRHNDLARDLGEHLVSISGRLAFLDMQLGPSGSPRPDVFSIAPSYAHPRPMAYEVKVTRSDFLSDVTSGKWMAYQKFACGVVFAVPRGLIDKKEVPNGCGLIVRSDSGWRHSRKATLSPITIPTNALLKLLFDSDRARVKIEPRKRAADEWQAAEAARRRVGKDVAKVISDLAWARDRVERAKAEAEKWEAKATEERNRYQTMQKEAREQAEAWAEAAWTDLRHIAGLPNGSSRHQVLSALRVMRQRVDESGEVQHLAQCIEKIRQALDKAAPPALGDERENEAVAREVGTNV